MQNTPYRAGPVAVTNTVTNFVNPPTLTGGVLPVFTKTYIIITKMSIVNKTGGAVNLTLYIGGTGASAAGTEFAYNATPVPANSRVEWTGRLRLDTADFITMLAGANTSLVIEAEGEMGVC